MKDARVIDVRSTDPRLADYVSLRESTLRSRDIFIAEGELVIRRAAEAGHRPRSFLLAPRWVESLRDVWERTAAPVFSGPADDIESLTGFHVHRGALAAFERGDALRQQDLIRTAKRLVIVEDLVDHANLGAIARTALGLGWDGLIVSRGSADPWYRRAIKASMGATLTLPWARTDDDESLLNDVRASGFTTVAMALTPKARALTDVAAAIRGVDRLAVVLGTEGHGLSASWLVACDVVARIDMAAGVDSLNVASAAAIACYELRR